MIFDVRRFFDPQTGSIASIGDDLYTFDGRFNESGFNSSYKLALNTDDTLQAAYTSDFVVCGENGCLTQSIDVALPRADSSVTTEALFTCPTGAITSIDPLITANAGATTSPSWSCTFVDQDDRDAEPVTTSVTVGRNGTGLVSGIRGFTWVAQDNQTIEASYTDGSGGFFVLQNIILYTADGITNRISALEQSIRDGENGCPPMSTWFEVDCNLQ